MTTSVSVRRTGGFAGRVTEGAADLDGDDPRAAELRELSGRIDLNAVEEAEPQPDRFVYEFVLGGVKRRVSEQHLTPDLRRLAELLLR